MKTAETEIKKQMKLALYLGLSAIIFFLGSLWLALFDSATRSDLWFLITGFCFMIVVNLFSVFYAFADSLDFIKKEREGRLNQQSKHGLFEWLTQRMTEREAKNE